MPNTSRCDDNATVTSYIKERGRQACVVNVFPSGAITKGKVGRRARRDWSHEGKAARGPSPHDGRPVMNATGAAGAMEYARRFNIPVINSTARTCI